MKNVKHEREGAAEPSQRQLRVGEAVRHALAEALARGETHQPELDGVFVTIPEVRMSPDLKVATVLVMPLGGLNVAASMAALDHARPRLKGLVGRKAGLRFAPDIRFRLDTRYEDDERVDDLLQEPEVARDLHKDDKAGTGGDER